MWTVTVYSVPNCSHCTSTCLFLDRHQIGYQVVDLSDPANQGAREWIEVELGYREAPVVVVDQDPDNHWSGFRMGKIIDLTKRKAA